MINRHTRVYPNANKEKKTHDFFNISGYNKENPECQLALKLVPKFGQSEADINALRRECKIQREVDHENIVKAIEAFETINQLVLVTEFVDGGNLAFLMSQNPQGKFKIALNILKCSKNALNML